MIGAHSIIQLWLYMMLGAWLVMKVHWEYRKRMILRDKTREVVDKAKDEQIAALRNAIQRPLPPEEPPHLHWSTPVTDMHGEPVPHRHLCLDCLEECQPTVIYELPDGVEFTILPASERGSGWLRTKDDPESIQVERVTFQDGRIGHRFTRNGKAHLVFDGKVRQVQTRVRN